MDWTIQRRTAAGGGVFLKISTKGRYAVRLMTDIAENMGDGYVSLKDTAERQGVSLKYLEQIVTMLCRNGFLDSQRGAQGGYRLAKPAGECVVGDILRATESGIAPVACLEDGAEECPRSEECPTIGLWTGLYNVINDYLGSVTIADLTGGGAAACGELAE